MSQRAAASFSARELADVYNTIYLRLQNTNLLEDILHDAWGGELELGLSQFSFLKKSELTMLKNEIRASGARCGLDMGCGLGGITQYLAAHTSISWVGIDLSEVALAYARHHSPSPLASFVLGSMESMPFENDSFDFVIAIDSVQHVISFERCASELGRVVRPNGILFFANWMQSSGEIAATDPFLRELSVAGFGIHATVATDPELDAQIKFYFALYERRQQARSALGKTFLGLMFNEAEHLIKRRREVGRYVTIAKLAG